MRKWSAIHSLIKSALKEDTCPPVGRRVGRGDITTKTLIPPGIKVRATVLVKQPGVIAGLPLIKHIYQELNRRIKVKILAKEGAPVKKGRVVAVIKGDARAILSGERTVLNFLARLSGIATLTHKFVKETQKYGVKILDTRKTLPGWRVLDKYAVKIGGGKNHRMGLYDAFLVKGNHLKLLIKNKTTSPHFGGSVQPTGGCASGITVGTDLFGIIKQLKRYVKAQVRGTARKVNIEVEVTNQREFEEALSAQPDIIMLDNMTPAQI